MSDRDGDDPQHWGEGMDKLWSEEKLTSGSAREWLLQNASRLPIDWDSLPKPPAFIRLFGSGMDEKSYRAKIAVTLMASARLINRPLTAPEVQSLSYHRAKAIVTVMYTSPLPWLAAFILTRRGRSAFRFPFYTPKPTFNPNAFPSTKRAWFRDSRAQGAWHLLRFGCYFTLSQIFITTWASSYAGAVMVSRMRLDPALAGFNQEVMEHVKAARARREGMLPPQESQDRNLYSLSREEPDEATSVGYEEGTGPMSRQPPRQDAVSQAANLPPAEEFDDGFDDASPVAPLHRPTPQGSQAKQVPAGSAWDRIRQRTQSAARGTPQSQDPWAQARQNASSARTQSPAARPNDDYTYSKADEEKSLAKDQAQKEFDDMLERERHGGSDDVGGGRRQ